MPVLKNFIEHTIHSMKEVLREKSYYPECQRKNKILRFEDNVKWLLKYREVNEFYNLYGFDMADIDYDFISNIDFMKSRDQKNKSSQMTILLRDKFLFYKYAKSMEIPVPEVFAVIKNGEVFDSSMNLIETDVLKEKQDYFVKAQDGECASYVKHIKNYDRFCEEVSNLKEGSFILQKRVFQSEKMNIINPCSINTVRMVTVNTSEGIRVLSTVLRIGTKQSGNVDNWAAGGIAVGVKEDGTLEEYGFFKPSYGGRVNIHPDTNIYFSDFKIHDFEKVTECAVNAHKAFYNVHSIGWDIALTEDGPVFIEGNDNWEISLMQACNHGLKSEWENVCR